MTGRLLKLKSVINESSVKIKKGLIIVPDHKDAGLQFSLYCLKQVWMTLLVQRKCAVMTCLFSAKR